MSNSRTDTEPGSQPLWQRLKDRFVRYAAEPNDPPDLKLRKLLGVAVFAVGLVVWPAYGVLYLAIGARLAAQICLVVVCMQVLCGVGYVWLRNYMLLVLLLGLIHMLAFLGLHFAFGGFMSSPYLLVYALLMPLLAPFTMEPRHTKYWVAGVMVLVLIAGVGERFFSHGPLVSADVLTLLTVSILLGFALFAMVPVVISGQRTRAINLQLAEAREAQLALKAEHLAQTEAALERQTATAEILKVIASSPSDVQPVFDAIVQQRRAAVRRRKTAVAHGRRRRPAASRVAATTATADESDGRSWCRSTGAASPAGPCVEDRAVQVADNRAPRQRRLLRGTGPRVVVVRAMASAPLMRDGVAIGVISMSSRASPARSPTDARSSLLQTFADQAVIAIQNARLFNETQESLQRQTSRPRC